MAMTFDATLKDMGRESPRGFLAAFDRPSSAPVKLLNVDLSTVTAAADLVLGVGETTGRNHSLRLSVERRRLETCRSAGLQRSAVRPPSRARPYRHCLAPARGGPSQHERFGPLRPAAGAW